MLYVQLNVSLTCEVSHAVTWTMINISLEVDTEEFSDIIHIQIVYSTKFSFICTTKLPKSCYFNVIKLDGKCFNNTNE